MKFILGGCGREGQDIKSLFLHNFFLKFQGGHLPLLGTKWLRPWLQAQE